MTLEGFTIPTTFLLESVTATGFSWLKIFSATVSMIASLETFKSLKFLLEELRPLLHLQVGIGLMQTHGQNYLEFLGL